MYTLKLVSLSISVVLHMQDVYKRIQATKAVGKMYVLLNFHNLLVFMTNLQCTVECTSFAGKLFANYPLFLSELQHRD